MTDLIARLLFPPKCHFCRELLSGDETDLCHSCRKSAPEISGRKRKLPYIAQWTAVWYYKDSVRSCIHRFKFWNARGYADFFAREMAMRIQQDQWQTQFDALSWVPVSTLRRMKRGYDQSQLLAQALGRELGMEAVPLLKKVRHTPPQSRIKDAPRRRANVLGAYRCIDPAAAQGQRILLVDDVVTSGATGCECSKMLMIHGAKSVYLAAVGAAAHDKNK